MSDFNPSPQQDAIFEDVAEGTGNTVVIARAGCGKTTTIVQSFSRIPEKCKKSVLMVAFNKSIATELGAKAPKGVTVQTLHSYGLRQISNALGESPKVEPDKMRMIVRRIIGRPENKERASAVVKICSIAKNCLATELDDIYGIIDGRDVDLPEVKDGEWSLEAEEAKFNEEREACARLAVQALDASKDEQDSVDFDDMIWFPNIFQMDVTKFHRVFVDETQDLNSAQIALVLKACRENGRTMAVGDPAQAIYGFRGAASGAVDRVASALNAKRLPLSITYRCPKKIVELARKYVPDFEAAPDAPEGAIVSAGEDQMLALASPGDFILSRTNAPLVPLCFQLLKAGKRTTIAGKDIGAKLAKVVDRAHTDNVAQLIDRTRAWAEREVARLTRLEKDSGHVTDTAECIYALAEDAATVNEIKVKIERLFSDVSGGNGHDKIVLSTTHKAKGLERDRVFLLRNTYMKWPGDEEENLFYVAITRAKKELYLVAGEGV